MLSIHTNKKDLQKKWVLKPSMTFDVELHFIKSVKKILLRKIYKIPESRSYFYVM